MTTVSTDDFGTPDAREVEFRVINRCGDVATLRATIVTDDRVSPSDPDISLSTYLVYVDKDAQFDPADLIETVTVMRQVYTLEEFGRENVTCDLSKFDPSTPGLYRIPIYCEADGHTGSTALLVMVEG